MLIESIYKYVSKSAGRIIRTSAYLLICTFIFSCAQVVAPGGGAKDSAPPKVVKYSPDSAQLNFNSKTIELTFDEYIQLKDVNNQLIISPPFAKTPDMKVKNKTLTIDLSKEELKPNTTYSINFGNALQDINENNAKENFSYIFSTGSFIDSLSLSGKVESAFDHKTEKGIFVMLYSDQDDSVVYKKVPEYFAKTIADGTFKITNIRKGKYKLVALKDANSNYKYDGDPEMIGFFDILIDPSEKKKMLIDLFQEPAKKFIVKKYYNSAYGKITLVFNRPSDSISVKNLTDNEKEVQEILDFSKHKDTLTYWIKNHIKDSLTLQVSEGSKVIDTVEFKMIKLETALKSRRDPFKLYVINSPAGNQAFDVNSELKLVFSQPIASINGEVQLKEDSVLMKNLTFNKNGEKENQNLSVVTWDSTVIVEDPNNSGTMITAPVMFSVLPFKENTNYHLFIPPGTFTDIFGLKNDTIKIDFKTRELKYYGSLKLKVTVPELSKGQYIVQLLNEKENVIRENLISKTETINYEYLHPDKYRLKIIYDLNANKQWDSGNYLQKLQPEKVIYNNEEINIRSNWDADIEWKITNNE